MLFDALSYLDLDVTAGWQSLFPFVPRRFAWNCSPPGLLEEEDGLARARDRQKRGDGTPTCCAAVPCASLLDFWLFVPGDLLVDPMPCKVRSNP
jgi:hypothetical protein